MRFNKSTLYIHLHCSYVYVTCNGIENRADFADTVVKNLEVVDPKAYQALLESICCTKEVKTRNVVVVLGEDVVFSLVGNSPREDFVNLVPLPKEKILIKQVANEGVVTNLAFNADLVSPLLATLAKHHCKIKYVIPEEFIREDNLIPDQIAKWNLLPVLLSPYTHTFSKTNTGLFIFFLLLLLIVGIEWAGIVAMSINLKNNTSPSNSILLDELTLEISDTKESTVTNTLIEDPIAPVVLSRDKIRVLVLNGSRIPGLAVKVSGVLSTIGISNTTLDNATLENTGKTSLEIGPTLSVIDSDAVYSVLTELLGDVSLVKSSTSSTVELQEYDVVVTTGRLPK